MAVHLETGGTIGAFCTGRECVVAVGTTPENTPASPDQDTKRCFPDFFSPSGAVNGGCP